MRYRGIITIREVSDCLEVDISIGPVLCVARAAGLQKEQKAGAGKVYTCYATVGIQCRLLSIHLRIHKSLRKRHDRMRGELTS